MIERWNIERCTKIRKLLGCSASKIARELYLEKQTILNWEHGKSKLSIENYEIQYTLALKSILEERGVTIEDLKQQLIADIEDL